MGASPPGVLLGLKYSKHSRSAWTCGGHAVCEVVKGFIGKLLNAENLEPIAIKCSRRFKKQIPPLRYGMTNIKMNATTP